MASSSFTEQTEKRLALAGNPGDLRVADWLGIKAIGAVVGAILFFLLFGVVGILGFPFLIGGLLLPVVGALFGYTIPEFWLGGRVKKRQKAILLMIPDALDLLTISVRAGLGFDAALGQGRREARRARCRTSSDGRWPRSASARRGATRCATSCRAPRSCR